MSIYTMLAVMLKCKGTPNSLELVLIEIIIKLHFMEFFDHDFIFTVSKAAKDPVLTIYHTLKKKLYIFLDDRAAQPCYGQIDMTCCNWNHYRAHSTRLDDADHFQNGNTCITSDCVWFLCKDKGMF
jgi:hypothetical protein